MACSSVNPLPVSLTSITTGSSGLPSAAARDGEPPDGRAVHGLARVGRRLRKTWASRIRSPQMGGRSAARGRLTVDLGELHLRQEELHAFADDAVHLQEDERRCPTCG